MSGDAGAGVVGTEVDDSLLSDVDVEVEGRAAETSAGAVVRSDRECGKCE